MARHPACLGPTVADQAFFRLPNQPGRLDSFLVERIEDRAQLGVCHRNFHDVAPADESHVDVIIEIERTRSLWRDPLLLEAGFGEDKSLARQRHVERLQYAPEIPGRCIEGERRGTAFELLLQSRDNVFGDRLAVVDRRMLEGVFATERPAGAGDAGDRQQDRFQPSQAPGSAQDGIEARAVRFHQGPRQWSGGPSPAGDGLHPPVVPIGHCTRPHLQRDQQRQMEWHMACLLNSITGSESGCGWCSAPANESIAGLSAQLFEPVDAERAAQKNVFRPVAGSEDRAVDLLLRVDVDAESSQILQPEIAVAIDLGVG